MTTQSEHFTISIGIRRVTKESLPAQGRGMPSIEKQVHDVTDVATRGTTKRSAIEKAIRLLQVELEGEEE